MNPESNNGLEVWCGPECSIVRVADTLRDQLALTGHDKRIEDLDAVAALGIKTVRYPVLWEQVAPNGLSDCRWDWTDRRLSRLRDLGIRPIAGLLHHGSGPSYTDLLDPAFPEKLAAYAGKVAERYPWIDAYTPVNEPLTTARFAGLYGFWHPHKTSNADFVTMLLNQYRGIALAMRAIRRVNSKAQLVQTEDLGKTSSTSPLAYQAEFENKRRWLTFDLLCGRTDRHDAALWGFLTEAGADPQMLDWFVENPTPPDIIGVNHYLTSDRFLDHRLERYDPASRGGNGSTVYVDVEAVRVLSSYGGIHDRLAETWERYHLPIAVTEVHLDCSSEEQIRWLLETWQGAIALKKNGADIRAITAWSCFGAYDWNSLLTRSDGHYESGLWDVRSEPPQPTLLAQAVSALAHGERFDHPESDIPGWWRQPSRFFA